MEQTPQTISCGCTGMCRSRCGRRIPGCMVEQDHLPGATLHTHPEDDPKEEVKPQVQVCEKQVQA